MPHGNLTVELLETWQECYITSAAVVSGFFKFPLRLIFMVANVVGNVSIGIFKLKTNIFKEIVDVIDINLKDVKKSTSSRPLPAL